MRKNESTESPSPAKLESREELRQPETQLKKEEPALAPDPASAAPSKSDELVDAWFANHFHGLGSMLDERLYNHVYAAKEDLKAELKKL